MFELYRVAAAGGPEQRLTSHGGYDDGPDYTPDGKWIYFNSNRSGGWDIWRIPPDGAGEGDARAERITSDELEDWFPHVSPDGKWIVFLSFPKGTENHNGKMAGVQLRLMPDAREEGRGPEDSGADHHLRRAGHHQRELLVARFEEVRVCHLRPEVARALRAGHPRVKWYNVISGGAPTRMGIKMVPMPRLTYSWLPGF